VAGIITQHRPVCAPAEFTLKNEIAEFFAQVRAIDSGVIRVLEVRGGLPFRKLDDAVAAMLTQRNVEEAARSVGVATATLMRWQKLPEFQTAYRDARRAAYGQAVARLQQGTSAAATTLLKTMIDPNAPASVRLRAAEAIFNHAAKAIEIEDIEARVAELERAAESSQGSR
jgi:hypothetical protein